MTAITVKYGPSVPIDGDFDLLMRMLSFVPMIVFGSKDVQVEPLRMDGPIRQFVMDDTGSTSRTEDSSIVLNIFHVHQEATPEDNSLVARATLAVIQETLASEAVRNPNSLVIQNGSSSYGWAEGKISLSKANMVVDLLESFWLGKTTRDLLIRQLRDVLDTS